MAWPDLASLCVGGDEAECEVEEMAPPRIEDAALMFDEDELARATAATAREWLWDGQRRTEADLAAKRISIFERLQPELLEALRARRAAVGIARRQLIDLAEAMALVLAGGHQAAATRPRLALDAILPRLHAEVRIKVTTTADAATALQSELPGMAQAFNLADAIEVETDPHLPDGAVRITWSDGWAEYTPELIATRLGMLLEGQRAAADEATIAASLPSPDLNALGKPADDHD